MTQATIPKIESTYEYGKFKLMKGNRAISPSHVKELKREMQRNPELLAASPILVNENYFIIDGQHRYEAAKELRRKLYYIISDGTTIDHTRHLNTTQRRWSLIDFARSFADSGRKDYIEFLEMHDKFPLIPLSILRLYLVGRQLHDLDGMFRRGEFEIFNKEISRHLLGKLNEVITITHVKISTAMAVSLLELMTKNSDFDMDLFIQKLHRESARELFTPVNSRRGCMRSIEAVYNFQSKTQKRLY